MNVNKSIGRGGAIPGATIMNVQCERCKQEKECQFAGRPSEVDNNKAQNGEWLCEECQQARILELDEALANLKRFLQQ